MHTGHRLLLLAAFSLLLLSGCDFSSPWGSSSNGTEYGSTAPTGTGSTGGTGGGTGTGGTPPGGVGGEGGIAGTDDSVVATPSVASVAVATGSSQTISITFTSSDGLAITGFGVSGSLGTLPAGWSGPSNLTCALVAAGSGCVLNLTYAPAALDSGTITIDYIYVDNANLSRAPGGSVTIPYQAVAQNNVIATASPAGQINAVVGSGNQSVSINFTTDDGYAATNLTLTTALGALPTGWSSTASSFSCAIVSSGSGCQLVLSYAPTAAGRGTLMLNYTYTDDSGASRNGSLNVPYSTTSADNVIATASPTGQINAIVKTGSQAVAVTFTTDDGKTATNLLLTSDLATLPAGWSSAAKSFTCANISTGNGCQLHLTYAPTALAGGTLILNYAYSDDTGTAQTGSLNLTYAATTNDNVVATASPSGQISAIVGTTPSQAVSVTFTTDDGRPATALQLTSSLTALPAGWSSADSSFTCSGLSSGNGCQLTLTYAPTAAGTGTVILNYSYTNNAGESKTGSLNIPYRATTNNTIIATASSGSLNVFTGSSNPVNVTFTTSDGNPASGLSVTSGLTTLPMDWTSPSSSFTCATVSVGAGCQLSLTYAPTVAESGMVMLTFSYTDNSGTVKTGMVSITYTATVPPP
jgi:hypothetical protein